MPDDDDFGESEWSRLMRRWRQFLRRYQDHPAVLMWGIGNEMEVPNGDDPKIWSAVEAIAKLAKELDPHHPTMTVVAGPAARTVSSMPSGR